MNKNEIARIVQLPIAQALLRSVVCRMAYIGRDGYPRVVPIGFLWKNDALVVCTPENAAKVRALQANPRVALTMDTEGQPPHILLIRGTAAVEIVDGVPDEYLEGSHKYLPPDQWSQFETEVRGLYKRMARITITPEWVKLIDFETTLPAAVEELVRAQTR